MSALVKNAFYIGDFTAANGTAVSLGKEQRALCVIIWRSL